MRKRRKKPESARFGLEETFIGAMIDGDIRDPLVTVAFFAPGAVAEETPPPATPRQPSPYSGDEKGNEPGPRPGNTDPHP